jgi:hypothetical protein
MLNRPAVVNVPFHSILPSHAGALHLLIKVVKRLDKSDGKINHQRKIQIGQLLKNMLASSGLLAFDTELASKDNSYKELRLPVKKLKP